LAAQRSCKAFAVITTLHGSGAYTSALALQYLLY
jgi:hypothetical protein